jgi:hypothetical protein
MKPSKRQGNGNHFNLQEYDLEHVAIQLGSKNKAGRSDGFKKAEASPPGSSSVKMDTAEGPEREPT